MDLDGKHGSRPVCFFSGPFEWEEKAWSASSHRSGSLQRALSTCTDGSRCSYALFCHAWENGSQTLSPVTRCRKPKLEPGLHTKVAALFTTLGRSADRDVPFKPVFISCLADRAVHLSIGKTPIDTTFTLNSEGLLSPGA